MSNEKVEKLECTLGLIVDQVNELTCNVNDIRINVKRDYSALNFLRNSSENFSDKLCCNTEMNGDKLKNVIEELVGLLHYMGLNMRETLEIIDSHKVFINNIENMY